MARKTKLKQRRRKLSGPFPTNDDIRAAWKLAEKVSPKLLALMEAHDVKGK